NVDILGHFFEKSINDIEKIRLAGLWHTVDEPEPAPKMVKSAERKRGGIYYTPPDFTEFIVNNTVSKLADETIAPIADKYGVSIDDILISHQNGNVAVFALEAIDALRQIKVVDPACGSGAFLIQAYDALEERYLDLAEAISLSDPRRARRIKDAIPDYILHDNIFGVDLSPEAVEITQLALWLRSAQIGKSLTDLSKNIIYGNSLIAPDSLENNVIPSAAHNVIPSAVEESIRTNAAKRPQKQHTTSDIRHTTNDLRKKLNPLDWRAAFPQIFARQNHGFDCVIGNPPWERFSLKKREFFAFAAPHVLKATNAAEARRLIAKLEAENPELHARYLEAKSAAEAALTYLRSSGRFPLTGKGDINTYAVFAELAHSLVTPTGRVGLLVPSGIATDNTTRAFFAEIVNANTLSGLYDFENRKKIFPDVDGRFKFSVLLFGGSERKSQNADFVFFAHKMKDLEEKSRHISLSYKDIALLNPNTRTCPVFRSKRDADITKAIYRRVPVLIDKSRKKGGNPWTIQFYTMFHQSGDAHLFWTADKLKADGFKRDGSMWKKRKQTFIPLCEAKMVQMYDHRAASVVVDPSNYMRQGQTDPTSLVQHQNPEFHVEPRWWALSDSIEAIVGDPPPPALLAFKKVTSPTNQRTMIAAFIPCAGVVDSTHLIRFREPSNVLLHCCLLSNLNSFILDYVARQKIGNVNLNFYLVDQFPMFPPDFYHQKCPWSARTTLEKWISQRVLKLTCTANDMIPLAKAAGFTPAVHKWNPAERADLMAELDAAYFLLYEIDRDDVEYILSTFAGIEKQRQVAFAGSTAYDRILRHYDSLKAKSK
ncbi:MAG: N-6 DNA methylase, partial [Sedimentisphaerales bacterium]|nr:N-6 DNA methylase [Sedimentisphaerales bacterium]